MESGNESYFGRCQLCHCIGARFLAVRRGTNVLAKEAGQVLFVEPYCERCIKHVGFDEQIVEVAFVILP